MAFGLTPAGETAIEDFARDETIRSVALALTNAQTSVIFAALCHYEAKPGDEWKDGGPHYPLAIYFNEQAALARATQVGRR